MLRGEQNGREVVEGLILHELGHHVYHRGAESQEIWRQSHAEGLQPLLNLVSDEQLERGLRSQNRDHGNTLKTLDAYAFQHANREVSVESLLDGLQARAAAVLTGVRLRVARRKGCVLVEGGALLLEMERKGLSFPRFMRALRMGLGNRHHDPKVEEALKLFKGNFRHSTMAQMLVIARRLRDIFGWETNLLRCIGPEGVQVGDGSDLISQAEGITNPELQEAVRRILERVETPPGAKGGAVLNVSPEEDFPRITQVRQVPFDPAQHAEYARQVARWVPHMRRHLTELGVTLEPQRLRVRGKRLDRGRLREMVLRRDPRVLISREVRIHTDLFLGVVIDCSGSMGSSDKIERAKLFGVLLAQATRGFAGIDLRLFGFTDRVIYDAGNAERCAVHGLEAGGGNNDAGALWHAAQAALASKRRARLLVMISDGLPTECSVAALKALVQRLTTRLRICCAQVAVAPLSEICFPHHVLLQVEDQSACVRRFGVIVARLVKRALSMG
jgi:hypothetical protein